jgi:hypothetical protein
MCVPGSITTCKIETIWLHHTNTSYSPSGIRQGYELEENHYMMQGDLVIYLFSRLTPKVRHFFRALTHSLPLNFLTKITILLFS